MKKLFVLAVLVLGPGAVGAAELYLGNHGSTLNNTMPSAGGSTYYKCQNSGSFSCQSDLIKISYTSRVSGSGTAVSPYILSGCSFISCACNNNSYLSGGKSCTRCSNNALAAPASSPYHTNTSCEYCGTSYFRKSVAPGVYACVDCPSNATCDGTTSLVCDKGYYGTTSCYECSSSSGGTPGTTKAAGAKQRTECYVPAGGLFCDETGCGVYDKDCYYES